MKPTHPSSYDDFADTFGKSRKNMYWPEIDEILNDFTASYADIPHWRIADIGCGSGRLVSHIAQDRFSPQFTLHETLYLGLDLSLQLLDQASRQENLGLFSRANWVHGDMRAVPLIPFCEHCYHGLFFVASYHHLMEYTERLDVLKQAKKLLTEDGKIYMINWNLLHPTQSRYTSSRTATYPDGSADFMIKIGKFDRWYHAFSEEEYHRLAKEAGLDIQMCQFGEKNSIMIFR